MAAVRSKIRRILQERYPGAEVHLHVASPSGRVGGTIAWDRWVTKDQFERQQELSELFQKALTPEEQKEVGSILTFTSYEVVGMREG
jgi:hypothetical protein